MPPHYVRAELLYKHPNGVYVGPNVEWIPEAYLRRQRQHASRSTLMRCWAPRSGYDDGDTGWPPTSKARNLLDERYICDLDHRQKRQRTSALFEPGTGRAVYGGVQYKW